MVQCHHPIEHFFDIQISIKQRILIDSEELNIIFLCSQQHGHEHGNGHIQGHIQGHIHGHISHFTRLLKLLLLEINNFAIMILLFISFSACVQLQC